VQLIARRAPTLWVVRTVVRMAGLVDWEIAQRTGARLARGGPEVTREQARQAVAELRVAAVDARAHVRAFTGLDVPTDGSRAEVVDRPTWLGANVEGFRSLLAPVEQHLLRGRSPGSTVVAVGSGMSGLELGAVLAWLSGKVLGQFEVFGPPEERPGRLLLVAPNIVATERQLDVVPSDFRLWVCLHEETHRVQFGAAPWLRGHLRGEIHGLLRSIDSSPGALARRSREVATAVAEAARGGEVPSIADLVQTPEQRVVVERLTAVMALLEGHADVVMDAVGPEVVPTVAVIRARFQQRRHSASGTDALLRRLMGLEAKMRQYRDGAVFVRAVVDRVGWSGLDRVWSGASALPTPLEIADPASWVSRMHPAA
jgi:coenzyme F420 biosynthesis associated uncharacterized protein